MAVFPAREGKKYPQKTCRAGTKKDAARLLLRALRRSPLRNYLLLIVPHAGKLLKQCVFIMNGIPLLSSLCLFELHLQGVLLI